MTIQHPLPEGFTDVLTALPDPLRPVLGIRQPPNLTLKYEVLTVKYDPTHAQPWRTPAFGDVLETGGDIIGWMAMPAWFGR